MQSFKLVSSSMFRQFLFTAGTALVSIASYAQAVAPGNTPGGTRQIIAKTPDEALNYAIANENKLDARLRDMHPVIETYIQQMQPDQDLGAAPRTDHYFLGKLDLSTGVNHDSYMRQPGLLGNMFGSLTKVGSSRFIPRGFAQMVIMDDGGFDRDHYNFQYVRREFLGDVRCLVYDVVPRKEAGRGRFVGRLWVEDQEYNVVRFNGTYGPSSLRTRYTHFDSWRVNSGPRLWLPAYVYTEETAMQTGVGVRPIAFKAQSRLWGYESRSERQKEEFTNITIDSQEIKDKSEQAADTAPVEAVRMWQRQAEDNLLDKLTESGVLAPPGEVDKVVQTVLENLEITNNINLQPEIRARVMMTTPLEAVYIGHTIVVSRGLLDVLPDEASLAAVIAHQLGHIVLGHQIDTTFAYSDRVFFNDDQTFRRVDLSRPEGEEQAADDKALELLKKSPYADKLPKVGLFLRALAARGEGIPNLVHPLIGNGLMTGVNDVRLATLMNKAPELEINRMDQVPALPIGARIKIDPWKGNLTLLKTRSTTLANPREKLAFEITPVILHLTRQPEVPATAGNTGTANPPPQHAEQTEVTATSAVRLPTTPVN